MNYKEYTKKEKESQALCDIFYNEQGWIIDRTTGCIEYDLIIHTTNNGNIKSSKIEEKFRYKDYDDFLIEIIQDVITMNMGWYYKTEADRIFYWVEDRTLYSVNWMKFMNWLKDNWKKVNIKTGHSIDGFGLTVFMTIKWSVIPEDIYIKFPKK